MTMALTHSDLPATAAEREAMAQLIASALALRHTRHLMPLCTVRSDDPARPALIPMTPWPYQAALADRLDTGESIVILKSRQLGLSTMLRAYVARRAAFDGWAIGYYSRGQDEAIAWLDALQAMIEAWPATLRPPLRRSGDLLDIGSGSIRVFPSTTAAGVGYTFQCVIADEAAHHAYGRENYGNYAPTLSAGGQFLCLSTSNPQMGAAGWFYEMWQGAQSGSLPYAALFLPWHARPDRDADWLDARRAELGGWAAAFHANYPEHPEQAFTGMQGLVYGLDALTGRPTFDAVSNVRPTQVPWRECKWRVAAIDPGGSDPTAVIALGVSPAEHMHVYGEYYRRGPIGAADVSEYLGVLHAAAPLDIVFVDPSQASLVATLRQLGWNAYGANNDKSDGIATVGTWLRNGRLTMAPECRNLIAEFQTYWWAERRDMAVGGARPTATRTPAAHHADALDALRYAVLGVIKGLPRSANAGVVEQAWDKAERGTGARETLHERVERLRGARKPGVV